MVVFLHPLTENLQQPEIVHLENRTVQIAYVIDNPELSRYFLQHFLITLEG